MSLWECSTVSLSKVTKLLEVKKLIDKEVKDLYRTIYSENKYCNYVKSYLILAVYQSTQGLTGMSYGKKKSEEDACDGG